MTTANKINPAYALKGNLVEGHVSKHLMRLAMPMTWGVMALISFQLVDIYFISRLGTQALAALSFTMPVCMIVFNLTLGLTIAMSSVISRLIGEGDHEKVVRVTTQGLAFAFFAGLVIAGLGLLLIDPVFRAMGANEDMIDQQ